MRSIATVLEFLEVAVIMQKKSVRLSNIQKEIVYLNQKGSGSVKATGKYHTPNVFSFYTYCQVQKQETGIKQEGVFWWSEVPILYGNKSTRSCETLKVVNLIKKPTQIKMSAFVFCLSTQVETCKSLTVIILSKERIKGFVQLNYLPISHHQPCIEIDMPFMVLTVIKNDISTNQTIFHLPILPTAKCQSEHATVLTMLICLLYVNQLFYCYRIKGMTLIYRVMTVVSIWKVRGKYELSAKLIIGQYLFYISQMSNTCWCSLFKTKAEWPF